jgi:flavin reductase (DIM6/NTAB) family NADH-FMN oxidoreductase RutF
MIDFDALFKISYGLYIVCSGNREKGNGFISNSVLQVTAEPPKFAVCCNKNNFTAEFFRDSGCFTVSVLKKDAAPELFGRFGYRSGRDFDKLAGLEILYGETGAPVVINDAIAWMECRVDQTVDVGTHLLFIGPLVQSVMIDPATEPMTYAWFREVKKGHAPKNAPTYVDPSKART